ncbi:hypothetical protein CCFV1_ORF034 [Cotesia congregata filamentous virus 1]|uniref:Uncharacterized protein n=1 Tax=Cotesia congregata filamentous virus 1 TaxID=3064291 RepID=A0ABC8QMU3_9VIRU|nr:hypothetical protein CCFV1_ORF034 [Cotesia congregata filamentous virus 1]
MRAGGGCLSVSILRFYCIYKKMLTTTEMHGHGLSLNIQFNFNSYRLQITSALVFNK